MEPNMKRIGLNPEACYRELTFDFDITDFDTDGIRKCLCSKGETKNVCLECWQILSISSKITRHLLATKFGFKKGLWVFSGKKGLHCWVKSTSFTVHNNAKLREQICDYFEPFVSGGYRLKSNLCDKLKKCYTTKIQEWFNSVNKINPDVYDVNEQMPVISRCIEANRIDRKSVPLPDKLQNWEQLFIRLKKDYPEYETIKMAIILKLTFPRIDKGALIGLNHLLKSPMSIHPDTGNVCLPIRFKDIEKFDPTNVLNISQLDGGEELFREKLNKHTEIWDDYNRTLNMMYDFSIKIPRQRPLYMVCRPCFIQKARKKDTFIKKLRNKEFFNSLEEWKNHMRTAHKFKKDAMIRSSKSCMLKNHVIHWAIDKESYIVDFKFISMCQAAIGDYLFV